MPSLLLRGVRNIIRKKPSIWDDHNKAVADALALFGVGLSGKPNDITRAGLVSACRQIVDTARSTKTPSNLEAASMASWIMATVTIRDTDYETVREEITLAADLGVESGTIRGHESASMAAFVLADKIVVATEAARWYKVAFDSGKQSGTALGQMMAAKAAIGLGWEEIAEHDKAAALSYWQEAVTLGRMTSHPEGYEAAAMAAFSIASRLDEYGDRNTSDASKWYAIAIESGKQSKTREGRAYAKICKQFLHDLSKYQGSPEG